MMIELPSSTPAILPEPPRMTMARMMTEIEKSNASGEMNEVKLA